ncbi:helix-turn-helix domain-containing protein [Corynebacterium sp.]|jgi:transposase|uniref:helix-turn-helix domain-containing protein n=1 Tax=Corynebacterium sp. TaxID=1720 RepID=UPI0025C1DCC9|nr:helix-turn-helix domain-containing protein [Corynebacterium sp.]
MSGLPDAPRDHRRGRPTPPVVLTDAERTALTGWADDTTTDDPLALRSRIILACATGATNTQVAATLKISRPTVGKWRSRFLERRLDGLTDDPRPGRPPRMTEEEIRAILATPPPGRGRPAVWTRRELARRTGLSASTVGRIWKNLDLPDSPRHPRRP